MLYVSLAIILAAAVAYLYRRSQRAAGPGQSTDPTVTPELASGKGEE